MEFSVKLCFYNVRSYTHNVSPTWLSKYELNKNINNRHTTIDGDSPVGFNLYKELYIGIQRMLRTGGIVFSREESMNWLSNTIWSAMKTYKLVTLCRLIKVFYVFSNNILYMYIWEKWMDKKAMELKENKEGSMGGFGRRKWKETIM